MNTIKTLGFTGAAVIAVALLAPYLSVAEIGPAATQADAVASSTVHRVSHSLAGAESYTSNGPSGYKWGRKVEQAAPGTASTNWSTATAPRSGYKWGSSSASGSEAQTYAGTTTYSWGAQGYAKEAGYKWGIKNNSRYAEQAGYKWGIKNNSRYAEQAGYKWGIKNNSRYAEQAGYKWGIKNNSRYAEQAGYKWGIKNNSRYAEQS